MLCSQVSYTGSLICTSRHLQHTMSVTPARRRRRNSLTSPPVSIAKKPRHDLVPPPSACDSSPSVKHQDASPTMATFSALRAGTTFINKDASGSCFIDCSQSYIFPPISLPSVPLAPASSILPTAAESATPKAEPGEPSPASPAASAAVSASQAATSLAALEHESHVRRAKRVKDMQESNQTSRSYARHVKNYESFFNTDQDQRCKNDSSWTPVPAFPVTATKVAVFVEHELTREKVKLSANQVNERDTNKSVTEEAKQGRDNRRLDGRQEHDPANHQRARGP